MVSQVELVGDYLEAHNRHDVDGTLAYLHQDVRFVMPGVWTKTGLDEIRALAEWDATLKSRLEALSLEAFEDRVQDPIAEQNDWFKGLGIEEIRYQQVTFTIVGDRILEIEAQLEAESVAAIEAAPGRIARWASQEHPEVLATLLPGGAFSYGKEQARAWLALIEEWQASGG